MSNTYHTSDKCAKQLPRVSSQRNFLVGANYESLLLLYENHKEGTDDKQGVEDILLIHFSRYYEIETLCLNILPLFNFTFLFYKFTLGELISCNAF